MRFVLSSVAYAAILACAVAAPIQQLPTAEEVQPRDSLAPRQWQCPSGYYYYPGTGVSTPPPLSSFCSKDGVY